MKLKTQAVIFVDGCLLVACVLLGVLAYINSAKGFDEAYISKVADVAERVEQLIEVKYPGEWNIKEGKLYKGSVLMEGLSGELDALAGKEAVTIFNNDTRVSTNIMKDGQRAVGTKANEDIVATVMGKGKVANVEADVIGVPYYTCYQPIIDGNGKRVGMLFVGAPSAPVIAQEREFLFKMALAAVVLFLIVGAVSIYIINRKMNAVYDVTETMTRIAAGDLTTSDITVVGSDELAQLAINTNKMKNTMHELMKSIGVSASQVAAGSKNISDSGNMLAQGATTQAASVEQLSATIQEITNQTAQNAQKAEHANNITSDANGKADMGNKRMNEMLKAMGD
ncbi:methyl-accepting chemotaxis protein, partial [Anaerovibrio lipolyticus]|uniref:methyl-accepting chemotaxis protein n=1 Tax=Anaerovibrio lipolyticus TaxID=82374 RepID=UPI0026EAFAE4